MNRPLWEMQGGIRIEPDHKRESTSGPIRDCPLPEKLFIPLRQHLGASAEPCVEPGQSVLKGQMIADHSSWVSAPIHAPTSGKIIAIGSCRSGRTHDPWQSCILLEPDGKDEWIEKKPVLHYQDLTGVELVSHIRNAGVVGLGGAGFPTAAKLNPTHTIDILVINGMECEPYISCDDMLMREHASEILRGAEILRYILGAEKIIVGLEDNKPLAAEQMHRAAADSRAIEIAVTPTLYPSGAARQTVKILTGRETPSDAHTADIGVICVNVATAAAVYRAVVLGEPLISRVTTVTGLGVNSPGNFNVRIGTPVEFLLQQADVRFDHVSRLIIGGPMMGYSLEDSGTSVDKRTNCVIAGTHQDFPTPPPELPCIRCGNCAVVCPVGLQPQMLYLFAKGNDLTNAQQFHLQDCIECGACNYVCPSRIPLVDYFRRSKASIIEKELATEKADLARMRFESRQARLAKEEAEKEQRRQARADMSIKAPAPTSAPSSLAKAVSVDPLTALQTALNTANKKLKTAEAALATAVAANGANQEEMQQKVDRLREKAQAAKQALEQAKHEARAP